MSSFNPPEYRNTIKKNKKLFLYNHSITPSVELSVSDSSPIIYDELPDLDIIFRSEEDFLKEYFVPSLHKLRELENTLTSNIFATNTQYFITDDLCKIFLDDMASHNCHDIITDITDPALLISKLNKRPGIHSGLFQEASKVYDTLADSMPIIKFTPKDIFCKVLVKNFSLNFIHKISTSYHQDKKISRHNISEIPLVPMSHLARSLGESLINQLMLPVYCNVTRLAVPKDKNLTHKYTFTYKRYPQKKLKQELDLLEHTSKLSREKELVKLHLKRYLFYDQYVDKKQDHNQPIAALNELNEAITNKAITYGAQVIQQMIDLNIVTQVRDKRQVPSIKINKEISKELFTCNSGYNPLLTSQNPDSVTNLLFENLNITFGLEQGYIKQSENTYLKFKPELYPIVKGYSNQRMSIPRKPFEEYTKMFGSVNMKTTSTYVQADLDFLLATYQVNFNILIKNNPDKPLVIELLAYALDFTQKQDSILAQKCHVSQNISCIEAYNKISSTKIFLKGFLNSLNIYSRFNYFFIPKRISSTGRFNQIPFYITLQGPKIAKGFITFEGCKYPSNEVEFHNMQDHLLTAELKKELNFVPLTYKEYLSQIDDLYITQIKAHLIPESNLDNYPIQKSYAEQLRWLVLHVKKPKLIFHIKLLLEAYFTKDTANMMYEMDATSSSYQHISLAGGYKDLANICNIQGEEYCDIYSLLLKEYRLFLQDTYVPYLSKVINHISGLTLQEFIAQFINYNEATSSLPNKVQNWFALLKWFEKYNFKPKNIKSEPEIKPLVEFIFLFKTYYGK